ncbi:MAG: hypothetical protein Q7K26_06095 [bacterium]|nr:hypothetical protein [bacterium]
MNASEIYGVKAAKKVQAENVKLWGTTQVIENLRLAPAAIANIRALEKERDLELQKEKTPQREL